MRDKIFYSICFGFVLGIFIRTFIFIDLYFAIALVAMAFSFVLYFFISQNNWILLFGFLLLFISLGIFRFLIIDKENPRVLENNLDKKIELVGTIVDEPDKREKNQKLVVFLDDLKIKILINTNLESDFNYGDQISFLGKLTKPENFMTEQGKEFDYVNYLKKENIIYMMQYPKIEVLSEGMGSYLKATLFSFKEKFLFKLNNLIPKPESTLMGGLILGEKSSFSDEWREKFINTGTIHIIALSGYNVTIVAEWVMKLLVFLPFNLSIYLGIFSVFLFVLMTGASSTAVRAGVMAALALFARATGRNYDVARALILAGVIMIFFNPRILAYDVSFQLSFLATFALIFFTPMVEKYFYWVTKKFKLRDVVSTSVAVYLFVLPFILYKMGNLSLVAIPANILILPFIPATMLFGFLTGAIGFVFNILAIPFGFLAKLLLQYELFVVNFFSNFSFASFSMPNFPLFITILIYAYFIYILFGENIKKFFMEIG